MPSLDDLKKRITSVKSTQKITKAMKMVATAKLRKAQESAEKGRPYSEKMNNIILNLLNGISDKENLPKLAICLDMVADADPMFKIEYYSYLQSPDKVYEIWNLANELGFNEFNYSLTGPIYDDHRAFYLSTGIPSIDIINLWFLLLTNSLFWPIISFINPNLNVIGSGKDSVTLVKLPFCDHSSVNSISKFDGFRPEFLNASLISLTISLLFNSLAERLIEATKSLYP